METPPEVRSRLDASAYPRPPTKRDGDVLTFVGEPDGRRPPPVWDDLWEGKSPGRIAVSVSADAEHVNRVKERYRLDLDDIPFRTERWNEQWRQALSDQLYALAAKMELPGDYCPALEVPRFVHGQSQGITDLFGVRVEAQPDGNFFPHPLPPDPKVIAHLVPRPLETSAYWGAVEWIRYARGATHGVFPFRNPVMTGPLDTANYILGTTTLLPPAEPVIATSVPVNVAGSISSLNTAVKLIGDTFVGSGWPAAWLMVTVGPVLSIV